MARFSRRLIDITGMRDVVQRRIPVLTLDSGQPGATVWLAGCIHGDEPGGTVIIHDVIRSVRSGGVIGGRIHALPLINSMGFENVSRFVNSDREDLNRCFPGSRKGTEGERIARRLFDLIARSDPDLVIDLHNDWIQSVPHVLVEPVDHFDSEELRQRTLAAARATGLMAVQESDLDDDMEKTLSGALVTAGIPALTIESGGACGIVESAVDAGRRAVMGALRHLGIVGRVSSHEEVFNTIHPLDYTSRPRCGSSGLIRFTVAPGDEVKAGDVVARVYSAFGSLEETLRVDRGGYVLGISDHARAVPGSEVIAIAAVPTLTLRLGLG